jgi:aminodeoxyfutalosine synthase
MLTQKIAQVALRFGANDLDGTVIDERITHAAGGVAGKGMTRTEIEDFIREAGRVPVERNTTYTEFKEILEREDSAGATV